LFGGEVENEEDLGLWTKKSGREKNTNNLFEDQPTPSLHSQTATQGVFALSRNDRERNDLFYLPSTSDEAPLSLIDLNGQLREQVVSRSFLYDPFLDFLYVQYDCRERSPTCFN
jgi:hypothetical protein